MRFLVFLLLVCLVSRRMPDLMMWGRGLLDRADFYIDGVIRYIRDIMRV
jgi:hypothetical protein